MNAPVVDDAVIDLFHSEYRTMVGTARLLLGSDSTAEEVVQEAFIRLLAKWPRLRDHNRAVGYLRATVVNLARGGLRRRGVALRYVPPPGKQPQQPDEAVLDTEARDEMAVALNGLPRRQRECLVLRYYAGLTEPETATALGIAIGSVKSHTHRGLATLEHVLKERS